MAQAPHEPTDYLRGQVKAFAGMGLPLADIARRIRISENTLRKYYDDDIADGVFDANATVSNVCYKLATTPGPQQHIMAMFWSKTRMRWREVHPVEALNPETETKVVIEGGLPNGDGD